MSTRSNKPFSALQPSDRDAHTVAVVHGSPLTQLGISALLREHFPASNLTYCGTNPDSAFASLAGSTHSLVIIDANLNEPSRTLEQISRFTTAGSAVVVLCSPDSPSDRHPVAFHLMIEAGAVSLVSHTCPAEDFIKACNEAIDGNFWFTRDLIDGLTQVSRRVELSAQQHRALVLYTSGLTMDAVGRQMGISTSTAKDYIDRVRAKYVKVGVKPRTKTELYVAAQRDGLIA